MEIEVCDTFREGDCGIYQIRNLVNNNIYIGSSQKIQGRYYNHRRDLILGKHHSHHLQRAFKKYGKDSFVLEKLISCDVSLLLFYEQQFIDQWNPEYNECKIAGSILGTIMSEETRKRDSLAHKGRKATEEAKKHISDGHKGIRHTDEERIKNSISHGGTGDINFLNLSKGERWVITQRAKNLAKKSKEIEHGD